ncbi:Tripartite motif-containing protein 72, partial [Geodia barretti]
MSGHQGSEETEVGNTEEISLQLSVPGVSRLEDVAYSKSVKFKGHQCWSVVLNASISLVNQLDSEKSYTKDFRHHYTRNSTDWGYSGFLRWREVLNPLRGFVKDDTILVRARLVYPGPDAHPDPAPSLSQSHSTQAPSSQLHTPQSHASSSLCRTSSSLSSCAGSSRVTQIPTSLFPPLSQLSSQDSMTETSSQLTPSSTSILPPEMASFLSCPHCNEQYEAEGQRSPNTLLCGHSFCLGCLERLLLKGEGGRHKLTCPTCTQEHSVDATGSSRPWFPNLSVAQLVTSVLSKAKHFCPIHQHDRNYYCFRDKTLVCIYCAYHGEHAGHHCQLVNEAKQTVRDELRPLRMRAQGRVAEAERRLQLMSDEGEAVRTQGLTSAKMVEEYFAGLEAALRKQRDLLLKDIHTHTGSLHSSIETQMKELERHHSKARQSLEDYEKWKAMSAREALSTVSKLTQTLQTTGSTSLPLPATQQGTGSGLRLHIELPSSNPLSSLGPLGHVTVTCSSSASPRVGPTVVDGPTDQEEVVELRNQGPLVEDREEDTQEPVDESVMDMQEEREGEVPSRGGIVKRTLPVKDASPDFELRS